MRKITVLSMMFMMTLFIVIGVIGVIGANAAAKTPGVGAHAGPAKAFVKEDVRQGNVVPIDTFFIENTGDLRAQYQITTQGGMKVEKDDLVLDPKEKVFLKASIQPDFSMIPGQTEGRIYVTAKEVEGKGIAHYPQLQLEFHYNLIEGALTDKIGYYFRNNIYVKVSIFTLLSAMGLVVILFVIKRKSKNETNGVVSAKGV